MTVVSELLFFCPDVTDASTSKRVQQFIDFGYNVTVFSFRRERYNTTYQPPWPNIPLGFTSDGRYWQRARALLYAIPTVFAHRKMLSQASVFYARNIEQLLLALFARFITFSRAPVVYEVLDISSILMRRGMITTLLRVIERLCLRQTSLLVLSSPGFHRNYFKAIQKYHGDWFLLENKLHPSISSGPVLNRRVSDKPWVVGYFGLIRGEATFDLITRLAERLQGRVLFRFGGILTTVDKEKFNEVLRRCPNIVYSGPYLPQRDLKDLYSNVDFTWALDLEHTDHNSRWLMPCRFYESGYFGIPCLAVHGFEVGNVIEKNQIGWTFDAPLEEALINFFEQLTPAIYEHICERLHSMPRTMFVADDDVTKLCAIINKPSPISISARSFVARVKEGLASAIDFAPEELADGLLQRKRAGRSAGEAPSLVSPGWLLHPHRVEESHDESESRRSPQMDIRVVSRIREALNRRSIATMIGVSALIWIAWRSGDGLLGTEVMSPIVDVPVSDGDVLLATGVVALTFLLAAFLLRYTIPVARPSRAHIRPQDTDSLRSDGKEMSEPSGYAILIIRRGPPPRPFGWEVRRHGDSVKVVSSTKTFLSRGEALADSARAAASRVLAVPLGPASPARRW
jgi:succinoglycan biosynthesis protein ExoL